MKAGKMTPTENFVIRILRRDPGSDSPVTGVVEDVEKETRQAFGSMEDLARILGIEIKPEEGQGQNEM